MKKLVYLIGLTLVGAGCLENKPTPQGSQPPQNPNPLTLISLNPASNYVNPIPATIIAAFSAPVQTPSPALFSLGGSCATLPTVAQITMSPDQTVVSAALTGGTCSNSETLTVSIDPTQVLTLDGRAGTGSAASATYTLSSLGPSVGMGAPSAVLLNASGLSTIAVAFKPSVSGGSTLTGALTAAGGGVTVSAVTGSASCSIGVSAITTSGATLTLSNCSGNGSFTVHVNVNAVQDAVGNQSTVSPESAIITVDNTPPTISSVSPTTAMLSTMPTDVTVSFSEAVNAPTAGQFVVAGNCTKAPNVSNVTMSAGNTIAVATLSGAKCLNGQKLSFSFDPKQVTDLAGNQGTGSVVTATYTLDNVGPKVTLSQPTQAYLNPSGKASVAVTFSPSAASGITLTGKLTAAGGGITLSKTSGPSACSVTVSSISTSGATVTLSACTTSSSWAVVKVIVDSGVVKDSLGNLNSASAPSSAITIIALPPVLQKAIPASGSSFVSIPQQISLYFYNFPVTATTSDISLSASTCDSNPTLSSIGGSGSQILTLNLSGGSCTGTESIVLSYSVTDPAGNVGTGTLTYTHTPHSPVIFVSQQYAGNIFGTWGADQACGSDPNNPANHGIYKAMLVDGQNRIACTTSLCSGGPSEHTDWVLAPNMTYVRVDGVTIVGTTNSAGLLPFPLSNFIGLTDTNVVVTGLDAVATGLNADWTSSPNNCGDWIYTSTFNTQGTFGLSNSTSSQAINYPGANGNPVPCDYPWSFYCVQQ